jgi:hypothetical protein
MGELLSQHASDPDWSEWPLRDYIRKVTGEQPMTRLISAEFDRVIAAITDELR